ncbi:MAG: thiamine-monophosphate [Geobacteraceae bacterium]|nr:MAG: thiamine-monophosphate [Geobacteraceae bacterium]
MKLQELGEFGLIGRIAERVTGGAGVRIGIGDDAAATEPTAGSLALVTSDMLVEGIHFDLSLCDPVTLGRKSLSVNLSDIAAMGGRPRHFLLSLAIPKTLPVEFLDAFIEGLLERAGQFRVALIGGDTCSSKGGLVISITVMGEQSPELVVRRSGAKPGDLICVTGTLGDSALGLLLLQRGEKAGPAVERHLDPVPRVLEGAALAEAGIPAAMIDISDGLLADLAHILDQSGVGARLELDKIPLSDYFRGKCPLITDDPYAVSLAGGEDYELLFTAPPARLEKARAILAKSGTQLSVIGEITGAGRLLVISADGSEYRTVNRGYNHFASNP